MTRPPGDWWVTVGWIVLAIAYSLLGGPAAASTPCTSSWSAPGQGVWDYGSGAALCPGEVSRLNGTGYSVVSCAVSSFVSADVVYGAPGGGTFNASWSRLPAGCVATEAPVAGDPPAAGDVLGYSTHAGLYTLVVGCVLAAALGMVAGQQR